MISLEDLTAGLGLSDLTTDEETALVALEVRVVAYLERETGRHFGPVQALVETLRGRGDPTLWLNESPGSISQVRTRQVVGDAWTVITESASDGFELSGFELTRKYPYTWRSGSYVEVTYNFGYAVGSEPGEIRQLVMKIVKHEWELRVVPAGVMSESVGPHSKTYAAPDAIPDIDELPQVRTMLLKWTHPV